MQSWSYSGALTGLGAWAGSGQADRNALAGRLAAMEQQANVVVNQLLQRTATVEAELTMLSQTVAASRVQTLTLVAPTTAEASAMLQQLQHLQGQIQSLAENMATASLQAAEAHQVQARVTQLEAQMGTGKPKNASICDLRSFGQLRTWSGDAKQNFRKWASSMEDIVTMAYGEQGRNWLKAAQASGTKPLEEAEEMGMEPKASFARDLWAALGMKTDGTAWAIRNTLVADSSCGEC